MARNEEKAQSLLNRWTSMKKDFAQGGSDDRRPFLASQCDSLPAAEKWRRQILREITRKVAEIQNAGLGEHRLRDLNDEINKLIREKAHWQRQIRKLGGPDYARSAPPVQGGGEGGGDGSLGGRRHGGYQYFGAARNLPGVRELFEEDDARDIEGARARKGKRARGRGAMYRSIDPDYYGFRDEDDGVLLRAERDVEAEARRNSGAGRSMSETGNVVMCSSPGLTTKRARVVAEDTGGEDGVGTSLHNTGRASASLASASAAAACAASAIVSVPSQEQVAELLRAQKLRQN